MGPDLSRKLHPEGERHGEKATVPQIGGDNSPKARGAQLCRGTYRFRGCTRISCAIVLRLLFRRFKLPSQQSGGLMYGGPQWMDYAVKPPRGAERRFDARSHFLRDRLSWQLRYGPFSHDGVSHDLLSYRHSEASLGSFGNRVLPSHCCGCLPLRY